MAKLKRLNQKNESDVQVECPVSDIELKAREIDYPSLSFQKFSKRYRSQLYKSIKIRVNNQDYYIQANFCTNPYCRWFGLPQHKYTNLTNNPSRYGLTGTYPRKSLNCKDVPIAIPEGFVMTNDYVYPMSNWSLALEIKRLVDINSLRPLESEYEFHKEHCIIQDDNPFDNPTSFQKRGKSSSNSQKYLCKNCGKMTNVLPDGRESFTYHQKRNDVLPDFFMQIVNRTAVSRTLELLGIGASTYYNKLEWVHRRCLEFLERNETKKLKEIEFDTLWLNTNKFIYYLNNIRKKGFGTDYIEQERLQLATHIIATVDTKSRYAFRTDLAYDYDVKPEDIEEDILKYKEDKLDPFVQKNARYRFSYYGNRKFKKEDFVDDIVDDVMEYSYLELRKKYVDGLHVNSSYTAYAQYFHIRNLLNAKNVNIICDDDRTLLNAMLRVFSEEIRNKTTHVYTCQVEKSLSKVEAYREYTSRKEELDEFQASIGLSGSKTEVAILKLAEELSRHDFFKVVIKNGKEFAIPLYDSPVEHPMPFKDEGIRYIEPVTNLLGMTNYEMAQEMINVNMRAINTYFNQLRRRCSFFERPLVTARGDGRSYIYSNFNPRYAHYMLTIARTYLNFCETYKYKCKEVTPAMRLGIADKPFTVQDILYFK